MILDGIIKNIKEAIEAIEAIENLKSKDSREKKNIEIKIAQGKLWQAYRLCLRQIRDSRAEVLAELYKYSTFDFPRDSQTLGMVVSELQHILTSLENNDDLQKTSYDDLQKPSDAAIDRILGEIIAYIHDKIDKKFQSVHSVVIGESVSFSVSNMLENIASIKRERSAPRISFFAVPEVTRTLSNITREGVRYNEIYVSGIPSTYEAVDELIDYNIAKIIRKIIKNKPEDVKYLLRELKLGGKQIEQLERQLIQIAAFISIAEGYRYPDMVAYCLIALHNAKNHEGWTFTDSYPAAMKHSSNALQDIYANRVSQDRRVVEAKQKIQQRITRELKVFFTTLNDGNEDNYLMRGETTLDWAKRLVDRKILDRIIDDENEHGEQICPK